MSKRDVRETELRQLLQVDGGRDRLLQILKAHLGLRPGEGLPIGTLLIQSILDHEFPVVETVPTA